MTNYTFKNERLGKDQSSRKFVVNFALMLLMLLLGTSNAFAGASYKVVNGLKFLLDSDSKTASLIANPEYYSGDVVIPESVKGEDNVEYKVVSLGKECFKRCDKLNSAVIPASVTFIGESAFMDCWNLPSITIPSSVTSIGGWAFGGCRSLTSLTIPSSVLNVGAGAFYGCENLTSITLSPSITTLEASCFRSCEKLTSIVIPSSVESISYDCFMDCKSLTSLTIPSSVKLIGRECFDGCLILNSLYFEGKAPEGLSSASIPTTCTLNVPKEYLQDYKDALGSDYKHISAWNPNESGEENKPSTPCATPTISYESGKLKFTSETAGAEYHYTINDEDVTYDAYSKNGEVSLTAAYKISAYATADGYKASDKAEATLYWVSANLEATNINLAKTRGIVASSQGGIVSISGLDNGEVVKFYAADGKLVGTSVAAAGIASCAVSESIVIAKVGSSSIKILVK